MAAGQSVPVEEVPVPGGLESKMVAEGVIQDAAMEAVDDDCRASCDLEVSCEQVSCEHEVRWALSGDVACNVTITPSSRLHDLQAQIFERTRVPLSEQQILVEGRQLRDGDFPLHLAGPVRLVQSPAEPRNTNLAHFSATASTEPLAVAGHFTFVRFLSAALYGEVGLYNHQSLDGKSALVAVKKMCNKQVQQNRGKETNEWLAHRHSHNAPKAEDALTEIAILQLMRSQSEASPFLLRLVGAFVDPAYTWLVTEYADGGDLFSCVESGKLEINENRVRRYTHQLLLAVQHLHSHRIGHRDISLENILLSKATDTIRLMDFGMAVQTHNESGVELRYFRAVGKDTYRAPECYVPTSADAQVIVPTGAAPGSVVMLEVEGCLCQVRLPPDAVPGRSCCAALWGYAPQAADMFACGVSIFCLNWKVAPWSKTVPGTDELYRFVHANSIEILLSYWKKPLMSPEAMRLIVSLLRADPTTRPSAGECLGSAWFLQMAEASAHVQLAR